MNRIQYFACMGLLVLASHQTTMADTAADDVYLVIPEEQYRRTMEVASEVDRALQQSQDSGRRAMFAMESIRQADSEEALQQAVGRSIHEVRALIKTIDESMEKTLMLRATLIEAIRSSTDVAAHVRPEDFHARESAENAFGQLSLDEAASFGADADLQTLERFVNSGYHPGQGLEGGIVTQKQVQEELHALSLHIRRMALLKIEAQGWLYRLKQVVAQRSVPEIIRRGAPIDIKKLEDMRSITREVLEQGAQQDATSRQVPTSLFSKPEGQ